MSSLRSYVTNLSLFYINSLFTYWKTNNGYVKSIRKVSSFCLSGKPDETNVNTGRVNFEVMIDREAGADFLCTLLRTGQSFFHVTSV